MSQYLLAIAAVIFLSGCGLGSIPPTQAQTPPAASVKAKIASLPKTRPLETAPAAQPPGWGGALTPKLALKYGHLAMFMIQCVPIDRYAYADDAAGRAFIETCSKRAMAGLRLAQSARERFGPDAAKPLILDPPAPEEGAKELIQSGDPAFRMIDQTTEVIDSGNATIQMGAIGPVIHARFTPDGWKINFSEVSGGVERHGDSLEYKEPDATLAAIAGQGEIDQALAKEVATGRFKSVDALKAERDQRNAQLLKKIDQKFKLAPKDADGAPATQPASGK